MKVGIIGLPSVGKSTLFQLLTGAPAAPPGGRPEARVGMARVPDSRVDRLAEMYRPKKTTWATVEYVDVPGVAKGEGQALVDQPALRGVDALVHVLRSFASDVVPHPDGSVDALRDAKIMELELILADLGTVERRLERLEANIKKANRPDDVAERAVFLKLKQALEAERPLREVDLTGAALNSLLDLLAQTVREPLMVQRYLPEIKQGDKRIVLIDGTAAGAVNRIPPAGDARANLHVGGRAEKATLTPRDLEICEALRPVLKEQGLVFVGIDVIGDWLTEINVTSPTGLQEIDRFDGACLEGRIWDAIETRYAARRHALPA